jgi:hypothetical protein
MKVTSLRRNFWVWMPNENAQSRTRTPGDRRTYSVTGRIDCCDKKNIAR